MMSSIRINDIENRNNTYRFTLSGVNVSLANALRRTILSDINTVVFNTTNYENSSKNCTITENTSRLNNEIIKQRLSCVPIHISDLSDFEIDDHYMELKVENTSESTFYVTTEHFNIINKKTNQRVEEGKREAIFPRNPQTQDYIEFLRLRPKVGIIPAEKIHLTCWFSIANAKQDGMFNVVSTCSYGFTVDTAAQDAKLVEKRQEWEEEKKDVPFEEANWRLLDGLRVFIPESFDFTVESIGVFSSYELIYKACNIINRKLDDFETNVRTKLKHVELSAQKVHSTMSNSYDFILEDDDYTIGKVLEYMMFSMYYENEQILSFCGYKKMHPHDPHSILRLAFKDERDIGVIHSYLENAAKNAIIVFCTIRDIIKEKSGAGGRRRKTKE
jgi:DNA-directed RNA polymerase subunit L